MWKPNNQPDDSQGPSLEPQRSYTPLGAEPLVGSRTPAAASATSEEQTTLGKSLVIKGEVSGSESLYIESQVEGSINLPGNRVIVGRNGVVSADINAREIVILGKVHGTMTASGRFDLRSEGSLTGDLVGQNVSIEDVPI
jgi:cytoskeletal protein CcmA (bactofilin family)